MKKTRKDRLALFLERLQAAPSADTDATAFNLVCQTLDAVEDEFSGDPNEPARWKELDRMFPPQADHVFPDTPRRGVTKSVTRGHDILIGANGSMEIWHRSRTRRGTTAILQLSKPGADGKGLP